MAQKFKHLHYIIDIVKNNPGIALRDLVFKLDAYNSPTSRQKLEKDLYDLRTEYEVPIGFDATLKGYVVDEENNADLRTFQNFAKQQALNGMLGDMLHDGAKVWDVVDIDDQMPIMQIGLIKDLIEVMLDKKRVRIRYHKFFEKEPDVYLLEPHLIRQVLKRWYLIAGDVEDGIFKTFGLERIIGVERTNEDYEPQTEVIKQRSRKVYGVSMYNEPREHVVIETSKWLGKYWETLPVHASQEVEYISGDKCRISFHVVVNMELIQLLASQLQPVKIIEPKKLREQYRAFIERKFNDLR